MESQEHEMRTAVPVPSGLSVARATRNSSRAQRAGKAVFTFGNVFGPLLKGAVFTLLVNSVFFSADAQILHNELIAPWEKECKRQIQEKYGYKL